MFRHSLFVGALLASTTAFAAERQIEGAAEALVIATGKGDVRISVGERFRIRLAGEADELAAVAVERQRGTLRLSRTTVSSHHMGGDRINIAIGDGAVSHMQIGDFQETVRGPRSKPVDVEATVPPGTILKLDGLSGHAVVGDTGADVIISCLGCTASLGRLAALRAELVGGGELEATSIDRRLEASITGNGQITVGDGLIDMAEVAIVGDGLVSFAGRSEYAAVTIVGGGEARFKNLANPAATSIIGSGRVVVGQ